MTNQLFQNKNEVYQINKNCWNFYDYLVYCNGTVWTKKQNCFRKVVPDSSGYNHGIYRINGKRYSFKNHRLVALLFIPNPNNYSQINHKNGIKLDNCQENLEWCTPKQNVQHAHQVLDAFPHQRNKYTYQNGKPSCAVHCWMDGVEYPTIASAFASIGYKTRSKITLNKFIREGRLVLSDDYHVNKDIPHYGSAQKCLFDGKEYLSLRDAFESIGIVGNTRYYKLKFLKQGRLVILDV